MYWDNSHIIISQFFLAISFLQSSSSNSAPKTLVDGLFLKLNSEKFCITEKDSVSVKYSFHSKIDSLLYFYCIEFVLSARHHKFRHLQNWSRIEITHQLSLSLWILCLIVFADTENSALWRNWLGFLLAQTKTQLSRLYINFASLFSQY